MKEPFPHCNSLDALESYWTKDLQNVHDQTKISIPWLKSWEKVTWLTMEMCNYTGHIRHQCTADALKTCITTYLNPPKDPP